MSLHKLIAEAKLRALGQVTSGFMSQNEQTWDKVEEILWSSKSGKATLILQDGKKVNLDNVYVVQVTEASSSCPPTFQYDNSSKRIAITKECEYGGNVPMSVEYERGCLYIG